MKIDSVQPAGWKSPRGYSNGMLVDGAARLLFVAGQVAWDANQNLVGPGDFVIQFRQAIENVVAVVRAAGGEPTHVVELTIYVTDKSAYLARQTLVGEAYRDVMGKHFPAMALVQVAGLIEDGALLEIQARAVLP
jgi:enamine deaminase RidA (YjgF/YER057c/UK114 family)